MIEFRVRLKVCHGQTIEGGITLIARKIGNTVREFTANPVTLDSSDAAIDLAVKCRSRDIYLEVYSAIMTEPSFEPLGTVRIG